MKRRKGFTLIELLAVIVILAIIALISTPIIIGVIEKARKGAFEDSAYGVLDAGRVYFVDKLSDQNKFEGAMFTFPEGGDLKISGEKPAGGTLSLDSTGKQALALYDKDKKWCALKKYNEEKITIKDYKEEECNLSETLAVYIQNKNMDGNTEGLFTDDFGNIRYRGNDSATKNYVTFNNEIWRVIGVFDGKVKLIRNEQIPNPNDGSVSYNASYPKDFQWDTHTQANGAETDNGKNDWSTSELQIYLNKGYYNSFTEDAKEMIETTKYNLGGIITTILDKKTIYTLERGTTVFSGRPIDWDGKISLMYISDYGYAAGEECTRNVDTLYDYYKEECKNNNWLFISTDWQWTITTYSSVSSTVARVFSAGHADSTHANSWMAVRPVIHLKANVSVVGGDGTSSNPYQLA